MIQTEQHGKYRVHTGTVMSHQHNALKQLTVSEIETVDLY